MEWKRVPHPPMRALTRSLREGFQASSTLEGSVRTQNVSYTDTLLEHMKNTVTKQIQVFYFAYKHNRNPTVETLAEVPYVNYYSPKMKDVFNNLVKNRNDIDSVTLREPVDRSDGSVEGMRKLKGLYEEYTIYLLELEKDRPLAEIKKKTIDSIDRFNAYYRYITQSDPPTRDHIPEDVLIMSVPSGDEMSNDKEDVIRAITTDAVDEVKTKYERLLYNDVVSVNGRGVPNDILARLKFVLEFMMNDFEEQYNTDYDFTRLNTYFRDISGGIDVIDMFTKLRNNRRQLEGYSSFQIIQTPFRESEPDGYNKVVIDRFLSMYVLYQGGIDALKRSGGLIEIATMMRIRDKAREETIRTVEMYNNIYSAISLLRSFTFRDTTSGFALTVRTNILHTPSTRRSIDNLTDIQYVQNVTRTKEELDDVKNTYIRPESGHFNSMYSFIRTQSYTIMDVTKKMCSRYSQSQIIYTQSMTDICSIVKNLGSSIENSGTVDGSIINGIKPDVYTSYALDTPTIYQKYANSLNAFANALKALEASIQFEEGALGSIQQRLKDAHKRFIENREIINSATIGSAPNNFKYPIESHQNLEFKAYLDAFTFVYRPVIREIEKQIGIFNRLSSDSLFNKAVGDYLKYTPAEINAYRVQVGNYVKDITGMPFVKICSKSAGDITNADINTVKGYARYPEETDIEKAMGKMSDVYDQLLERNTVIIHSLALIPTERVYVLNNANNLDGMSLTIPNNVIKYFTQLDYILVGGGASGSYQGMDRWAFGADNACRASSGGGSGNVSASFDYNELNKSIKISAITKNASISISDTERNDVKITIGNGGLSVGVTKHENDNEVAPVTGIPGGETNIRIGENIVAKVNGGLPDGGKLGSGNNSSGRGGSGGTIFGSGIEAVGAISYLASGVDAGSGGDFTGGGGGGGAGCYRGRASVYNMMVKSGAGGSGFAILYFTRQTSFPLSIFQTYIHLYSDMLDGPKINQKPNNFNESGTQFNSLVAAMNSSGGNQIVFSPKTLKYYRVNGSGASLNRVTSPYEIGYTVWDVRPSSDPSFRRKRGIVPPFLGIGTIPSNAIDNIIKGVPQPPDWRDPVPGVPGSSTGGGTEDTPFTEGSSTLVQACARGRNGSNVRKIKVASIIDNRNSGGIISPITLEGDTLVVAIVVRDYIENLLTWHPFFDVGEDFPKSNFILARSGNANWFSTINIGTDNTYIETEFPEMGLPIGVGRYNIIFIVKFSPNHTTMWRRRRIDMACDGISNIRAVRKNTPNNNIKGRTITRSLLSKFDYMNTYVSKNNETGAMNNEIGIQDFLVYNANQQDLSDAVVDQLSNWLAHKHDTDDNTTYESFANPPPPSLPQPIYRNGASLNDAFM